MIFLRVGIHGSGYPLLSQDERKKATCPGCVNKDAEILESG
jgi:hypothetical protein